MKISNRTAVIILAAILALSIAAACILWLNSPAGTMVEVSVNGEIYGRYPLNKDCTVQIGPESGSWKNVLVIENGKAYMAEADCPDKLCVMFPPLAENDLGVIYCAPHRVVIMLAEP